MRGLLVSIVMVLILLGIGAFLYTQGYMFIQPASDEPPEPVFADTYDIPGNYHLLQAQGGIPKDKLEHFGVETSQYAYLAAWPPIQQSDDVGLVPAVDLPGGLSYEMSYQFGSHNPKEKQFLEFSLDGDWDEVHFGFGFDKGHASDPEQQWSINFRVQVDGEEVYTASDLIPTKKPVFTKLDVSGANHLSFIVERVNFRNPFEPVLIDPFVIKAIPPAGP